MKNGIGLDGIRAQDLKQISTKIAPVIVKLVNCSLQSGLIPSQLKTAVYRPIYKGGKFSDYQNYRPIAQLSQIFKVMERFVSKQLSNYLHKNNYISSNQFAYQKQKGTNALLLNFSQLIFRCLDSKKQVLTLFIDYSKAFDVLDNEILIEKLASFGINGKLQKWFENYLNRDYVVRLWNTCSGRRVATGVPQGSILGPTLFLIYTNSLNSIIADPNTQIFSYADDVAIVVSHESLDVAESIMQNNFNLITQWSHDMRLTINTSKTKVLHIHSPHYPSRPISIISHSQRCIHTNLKFSLPCTCTDKLEMVTQFKYLGVTVDSRFKFDIHINNLNSKLRTCSYMIFQLRNFLQPGPLRIVYCALVESLIRYGLQSWGNTSKSFLDSVTAQQKRILKAMNSRKMSSHIEYFQKFNVLPAPLLFKYIQIVNFYYKQEYKETADHHYSTRTCNLFKESRFTNEYGRQLLEHTVPNFLNKLPVELRDLTKISEVKKGVKQWLLFT